MMEIGRGSKAEAMNRSTDFVTDSAIVGKIAIA
jgi:hypothetical protein